MSDDTTTSPQDVIDLPAESKFSYVFNGLSNGMLVSAAVVLARNVMQGNHSVDINSPFAKFMTVSGAVLGAVYGLHEANRVHEYRTAVSHELKKLRNEVNTHHSWHQRVSEKTTTHDAAQTL